MLPILFTIGTVKIYTFGIFLALGFFWGSFLLWKLIRLSSFREEDVFDGVFISLAISLFMGRLVYVLLNGKDFGFNILKFILINGYPGMSLWGCIVGGFLGFFLYAHSKKIKYKELFDYIVPALCVALGFGKLGSFFSGAEVGTKTTFLLKVRFANMDGLRNLTSLYEALCFFLAAWIGYKVLFLIRREKYDKGFGFIFFGWIFSLVYFIFDNLKQDRLYFLSYSFNKVLSGVLLLTCSFYFVYYFRSFFLKSMSGFYNFLLHYVKKTYKHIHSRTKKTDRGGTEKDTLPDRNA